MKLEDKVAIVTAAGRGIGRGIAMCLAEEGANVVVNSYHEDTTISPVDEIKKTGRRSLGIVGDITKPKKVVQVIEDTIRTFGRIDILVNNVGGPSMTPKKPGSSRVEKIAAEWDTSYEQNLKATVLMCEVIVPHFREQRSGKIINISSMAGRYGSPNPDRGAYSSMKAGIIRYTQSLADRLGPSNINVNCICPGVIYTDLWKLNAIRAVENQPEFKGVDPREWFLEIFEGKHLLPEGNIPTPLRREQTVEDIGRAVVFLVSDDSMNITGQSFNVDGGMIKS